MRSSFGRGEERDVDRTDSSGEGGTVASEKRTVVGVAEERTVWEESSMGGGGGGGAAEKRRRVRGDVASACRRARAYLIPEHFLDENARHGGLDLAREPVPKFDHDRFSVAPDPEEALLPSK